MSFSLNHIALLVITLVIGWLLGVMMSGRSKYRRLWRDEQIARREADRRLEAANARIGELEHAHAGPVAPVVATGRGRDDLSRIRSISASQEIALNEAGYHRYGQIAAISPEQEGSIEARLGLKPGTIRTEDWRGQARQLDAAYSADG